jgi:hypothetical protein
MARVVDALTTPRAHVCFIGSDSYRVAVYRSVPVQYVYNSTVPTWDEAEIDLESSCQRRNYLAYVFD